MFTGFDPAPFPLIRMIRGKVAAFNAHLRAIADRHDCLLVDLWSMRVLRDPRMWAPTGCTSPGGAPAGGAAGLRGARRAGGRGLA